MAVIAVSLASVVCLNAYPAHHVRPVRDGLEVMRVEAAEVPTEMVGLSADGNRTDEQLVRDAMRLPLLAVMEDDTASSDVATAGPFPALFGIGISEERERLRHVEPLRSIGAIAHDANVRRHATTRDRNFLPVTP
jgi:hypothetical protein